MPTLDWQSNKLDTCRITWKSLILTLTLTKENHDMSLTQAGILAPATQHARFLTFSISMPEELPQTMALLQNNLDLDNTVIGLGPSLVTALQGNVPGLYPFPALTGAAIEVPSTPSALWCWLRGTDRGGLYHRSRTLESLLSPGFVLDDIIDSFQYADQRDLTGYIDGTENPQGEAAQAAAIVSNQGSALDGSSYVAVQQWVHEFDFFDELTPDERDHAIGRRLEDNTEIADAPASAHIKRTAQESFKPEAFIVRRSMPWANNMAAGLYFIAFGRSFAAFEAQLRRMLGHEDGITDALFQFTRPVSGAYFWCPPIKNGKLNLDSLLP